MIICMNKQIKPPKRHFPYQHPTFGTKNRPSGERAWKKSVYYWWWEYLRRNSEYLACCENQGKGKLSPLYKDFGDIRSNDFKSWWQKEDRGATLFAEPAAESSVRALVEGEIVPSPRNSLTVFLPLSLPNSHLEKRVKALLSEIRKGRQGIQYGRAKKSRATYKFDGQPNLKALEKTLNAYDLIQQSMDSTSKVPYWKIALKLGIIEDDKKVLSTDSQEQSELKRAVMTAIVGRLKKRAENSIKNSALGIFP